MPQTTKKRVTETLRKERDLYLNYKKVLAKHGPLAKTISRTQLAIEANNMPAVGGFYYTDPATVLKIITKMDALDRRGKLIDFYPTNTQVVDGWSHDDPMGDWKECLGCNNLYFLPSNLPNNEPMPEPSFCPYCGSFIKENE